MIKSFEARAVAVKIVTESKGGKTPGIDNVLWNTPEKKWSNIHRLNFSNNYVAKSGRKVEILKSDGSIRLLIVPTIKDRAMQILAKLAVEPLVECISDPNS